MFFSNAPRNNANIEVIKLSDTVVCMIDVYVKANDLIFEPPHDKTNKMSVRPAKSQISLGINPV